MSIQSFRTCDEAIARLLQVLAGEYSDLSPAEHMYVLHMVLRQVIESAAEVERQWHSEERIIVNFPGGDT
jgi:hypothetical protein